MKKCFLLVLACAFSFNFTLQAQKSIDVGSGLEVLHFHAPWDGLDNNNRFGCHRIGGIFHFWFEVADSTLTLTEPFATEADVEPEDRVEIFFSPKRNMREYYCAEIDPKGRVLDYKANYYRQFDYSWNFKTLVVHAQITPWGYRIKGSITCSELERALGCDLKNGFWMGIFQDDFKKDESVHWYSFIRTSDKEPDFHKPGVLFRCTMNERPEYRGVVVYPNDITSVGLKEWKKRIRQSKINLIGLHAATSNDPLDTLEAFVKSRTGKRFLRLCRRNGVKVEYELHALQHLLPRELFATHPEYFRMDSNGQRVADYNFCFSNAEAVEAMRPQLEAMLRWMKPTTHRYFFWPDDKQGKFCHCEKCRQYSPSEQSLMYEKRLLAMLREYDRKATLAHLAYHQTQPAPVKVQATEGIFLEFAPILRDYAYPLDSTSTRHLQENLLAFPPYSQHILEYWLDESMYARWKRHALVPLPFNPDECRRDILNYRDNGAASITCFATWLNGDYIRQYGSTDEIFTKYGNCHAKWMNIAICSRTSIYYRR